MTPPPWCGRSIIAMSAENPSASRMHPSSRVYTSRARSSVSLASRVSSTITSGRRASKLGPVKRRSSTSCMRQPLGSVFRLAREAHAALVFDHRGAALHRVAERIARARDRRDDPRARRRRRRRLHVVPLRLEVDDLLPAARHLVGEREEQVPALAAAEPGLDRRLLVGDHLDVLLGEAEREELLLHHARDLVRPTPALIVVAPEDDVIERLARDLRDVAHVL